MLPLLQAAAGIHWERNAGDVARFVGGQEQHRVGDVFWGHPGDRQDVEALAHRRKIVRPGGLIVIDDNWAPSVRTAARYYEHNLGWTAIPEAFAASSISLRNSVPIW